MEPCQSTLLQPGFGSTWISGFAPASAAMRVCADSMCLPVTCSMARSNRTAAPGASGTTRPWDLLERARVRIVRPRFQAGDVSVGEPPLVLPELKQGSVSARHDRLAALLPVRADEESGRQPVGIGTRPL